MEIGKEKIRKQIMALSLSIRLIYTSMIKGNTTSLKCKVDMSTICNRITCSATDIVALLSHRITAKLN